MLKYLPSQSTVDFHENFLSSLSLQLASHNLLIVSHQFRMVEVDNREGEQLLCHQPNGWCFH